MDKKAISYIHSMKGGVLDNDYTLYDDGTVLHEFDRHVYPGGQDRKETLSIDQLSESTKQKLYEAASTENKDVVRELLKLDENEE